MKARMRSLVAVTSIAILFSACGEDATPQEQAQQLVAEGLEAHRDGDAEAARGKYNEALAKDPNNKFAHYNLGLIQQNAGDEAGAEAYYRKAIELDNNFVEALFNLATVRAGNEDYREAIELYEHIVELKPDYAEAHLNLGFAYQSYGQPEKAGPAFERAVQLDASLRSRIGQPGEEGQTASPPPAGQPSPVGQ